ncbi:MAG: hypothetical protein II458_03425 [Oscillospiraceae bacterium]|nr:hypothetical protein [Oscillospiraceae bacterium]
MYLDTVKEIQKLEEQMEQAKSQARTQAREAQEAAEKAGRDLLAETRKAIREADAAAMEVCEAKAARQRDDVLQAAQTDCQALRGRASGRMEDAVARIVGRVVGR